LVNSFVSIAMSSFNTPGSYFPPDRLLLGPGPSNAAPSVLQAMHHTLVGHLDPTFINMMEEIKSMLRHVFQTENEMTFPVSATGSAGMEASSSTYSSRATRRSSGSTAYSA